MNKGINKDINGLESSKKLQPTDEFKVSDFLKKEKIPLEDFSLDKIVPNLENLKESKGFDPEKSLYTLALLEKLKTEQLIKDHDFGKEFDKITKENMIALANAAIEIQFDNINGELYYMFKNEKVIIKDTLDSEVARRQISELIPEVPFDVYQGGILEKAREAEAIYKCFVVNTIFDRIYSPKIKMVLQDYNATLLKGSEKDFVSLLKEIQEDSSSVVRILISACNYKLSKTKSKKELKLYTSITSREDQELRELKLGIASNNLKYEDIILAEPTKARREVKREEMRSDMNDMIEQSEVGVIYRILSLNSEDIPTFDYNRIVSYADSLANQVRAREELKGYDSMYNEFKRKIKRRGFNEYLVELKAKFLAQHRKGQVVDFGSKLFA